MGIVHRDFQHATHHTQDVTCKVDYETRYGNTRSINTTYDNQNLKND